MNAFQLVDKSTGGSIKNDLLSGITVALALVPEAVAFAFVAGISPIVGLYGAFMMGLITATFGGRPGMISGATGAMAVVMVNIVKEGNELGNSDSAGLQYLFITLLLVGIIQICDFAKKMCGAISCRMVLFLHRYLGSRPILCRKVVCINLS